MCSLSKTDLFCGLCKKDQVVSTMGGDQFRQLLGTKIKFDGRPSRHTTWRLMLADKWQAVEREKPKMTAKAVRQVLLGRWGTERSNDWTARPGLTEDEKEAFNSLRSGDPHRIGEYRSRLLTVTHEQ